MIKFIVSPLFPTSFSSDWIKSIINLNNITVDFYDPLKTYDKKSTIIVIDLFDQTHWYESLYNNGYKIIVDNLSEIPAVPKINALYCCNKNWFWYNESLWYNYLGYDEYVPSYEITKNALLLMNIKKPHRDKLFSKLDLTKLLYSYVGQDIKIIDDIDVNDTDWQRHFNPKWYNSTAFSIVAETIVNEENNYLFITEKTFKPIAFRHPFIIFGQAGILQYLKTLGFETFENMFNESYDLETDITKRLENIVNQINNFSLEKYDNITLEKTKHNKNLFFKKSFVTDKIIQEIINPIIEYAET